MLNKHKWRELIVTYAALLGCEPLYDDYGHPERASSRQYWTAMIHGYRLYGHSRADVAQKWLTRAGYVVSRYDGALVKREKTRTHGRF